MRTRNRSTTLVSMGALLVVLFSTAFCGLSCGMDVTSDGLEILEDHRVTAGHSTKVWGLARNSTDGDLDWPMIVVVMKDGEEEVHRWADRIEKLSPGEIWRFEVTYSGGYVDSHRIEWDHPLHFG